MKGEGAASRLNAELEIRGTELQLLQDQARGSESAQLAEAVAATEQALEEAVAAAGGARQQKADMAASAQVRHCRATAFFALLCAEARSDDA